MEVEVALGSSFEFLTDDAIGIVDSWPGRGRKRCDFESSYSHQFGTIFVVVRFFVSGAHIFDLIELKTYDLRFLSRGHVPPSPAVMMAVIDEKSLDAEGRWPWPRSKIAALVDILSHDGASVIAFDIAFAEPDENSQLALIDRFAQKIEALAIKEPQSADFIAESKKHADNDLALANAIKNSSATIVLGYFFHMRAADLDYRLQHSVIDHQLKGIGASKYPFIVYKDQTVGLVLYYSLCP